MAKKPTPAKVGPKALGSYSTAELIAELTGRGVLASAGLDLDLMLSIVPNGSMYRLALRNRKGQDVAGLLCTAADLVDFPTYARAELHADDVAARAEIAGFKIRHLYR